MPSSRIRILIVDDSVVMRSLLRSVVVSDANLEVAGTAADGASALGNIESLRPDLVLLDVEMPVMDGLTTLRQLRARGYRMPVIMCSSLTRRGAKVTIEALSEGASDYVTKPVDQSGRQQAIQTLTQDLLPRIHALTSKSQPALPPAQRLPPYVPPVLRCNRPSPIPTVLVIGVSTGGPAALDVLLPALPSKFPLPVLIVQHMPEEFTRLFAERLNERCPLRVCEAAEGDAVRVGSIYIARGNWHLEVLASSCPGLPSTLHLTQGLPENHCRPSADVLFRSAAVAYSSGVLAVVLTGMGSDGLAGCRLVRDQGGSVLIQDEATSAVWGMPGAVSRAGLANRTLPLNALAPEILRIVSRTHRGASELRESAG